MRVDRLKAVRAEMIRLDKRMKELEKATEKSSDINNLYWHPRETGAIRRASMDLTRALGVFGNQTTRNRGEIWDGTISATPYFLS